MRPITFNAHLAYCNFPQLIQDAKAAQVGSILAYIDNLNHLPYILELQRDLPNTLIVARCWHPDDFRFHEVGHDNGWVMSPQTFLNFFGHLGMQGRVLNVMNEPHGYANMTRLTQWTLEIIREANRRNAISNDKIRLCVLNFGTGHPASLNGKDMEWTYEFDPILIELSNSIHYLGLHEYMPGRVWRVGRFKQMLARCARLKIKPPKVFISEFGVDTAYDGDPLNGFRSRNFSEEYYFNYLLEAYNLEYSLYVKSNILVGMAIFSYGDSGGWGNYRIDNARTFISNLINRGPKETVVMPEIYPALVPASDESWRTVLARRINGGGGFVRSIPTTEGNSPLSVRITDGKQIKITDKNAYNEWRQVIVNEVRGWTSSTYLALTDLAPENQIKLIDVPYISQLGNVPQNDCGPACVLMLIQNKLQRVGLKPMNGLSLATVLAVTPGNGVTTTTIPQLATLVSQFGMESRIKTPLSHQKIIDSVNANIPVMLLVSYKHILPADSFDGGHYVVVVGLGDRGGYWVHDPYHGGKNLYLSGSALENAVTDVSGFASSGWQGMVII